MSMDEAIGPDVDSKLGEQQLLLPHTFSGKASRVEVLDGHGHGMILRQLMKQLAMQAGKSLYRTAVSSAGRYRVRRLRRRRRRKQWNE